MKKRRPPSVTVTKAAISNHWAEFVSKNKNVTKDDIINADRCFACLLKLPVQRCHLNDKQYGGEDTPENLHLLCNQCHRDSEHLLKDEYIKWMINRKPYHCIIAMAMQDKNSIEEICQMLSTSNNSYKKDISRKTKEALKTLKNNNQRYSKFAPYGMSIDKDEKTLVENIQEIQNLNLMINLRKSGLTFKDIAKELNKQNILSRNNKAWYWTSVRKIVIRNVPELQNPNKIKGGRAKSTLNSSE